MDPDANLKELLERANEITRCWDDCNADGALTYDQLTFVAGEAERVAELVKALDGWIKGGGFLPERWRIV